MRLRCVRRHLIVGHDRLAADSRCRGADADSVRASGLDAGPDQGTGPVVRDAFTGPFRSGNTRIDKDASPLGPLCLQR
jgi:hypothetical protein